MPLVTKIFQFTSDTEGWSATTGNPNTQSGWYPPHRGGRSGGVTKNAATRFKEPLVTMGGCLRMTSQDGVATENYWELTTTWSSLGVPSDSSVVSVQANYLYRWGRFKISGQYLNFATFSSTDTGSGPFELRDSGGTLLGTFSSRINGRTRDLGSNFYSAYPDATGGYVPIVADAPNGWGLSTGSTLTVPVDQKLPSTTVKFRLRNLLPLTSGVGNIVRIKQDYIVINIIHSSINIRGSAILRGSVILK